MTGRATLSGIVRGSFPAPSGVNSGARSKPTTLFPFRLTAPSAELDAPHHHAELFYLQKQIQAKTPMVVVLEDGEKIEGCIEWYDRNAIKVRGQSKTLIYKSAIRYMYKLGDQGL
jgi:RNA chaperone Hfq